MTRALLLALSLLAGCDTAFVGGWPTNIPCSSAGTCPPDNVCVPGERMCRYRCNSDGTCDNDPSHHALVCDVDHFCRPPCGTRIASVCAAQMPPNNLLGGCATGFVCDSQSNICRPVCSGMPDAMACPSGFSCATFGDAACGGCRPQ